MKPDKIQSKLQKELNKKRYEHSLGVAYTATCLAYRYGEDPEKARRAGLLHDCAKQLSDEKLLEICKKNGIKVSKTEKENPFLLHGKAGSIVARKKYEEDDEYVLNAIYYHVAGHPHMTLLEKIIYISDYIEPNRDFADFLDELRVLAFEDLDKALILVMEKTLLFLNNSKKSIEPATQETYDYYVKEQKTDGK